MVTNEMATNEEILKFMKDISGKFDSLKEDVEGLKSSGARVETPTHYYLEIHESVMVLP